MESIVRATKKNYMSLGTATMAPKLGPALQPLMALLQPMQYSTKF